MASLSNFWRNSESIRFQSPTKVELEFFCLENNAFPKSVFSDTSKTVLFFPVQKFTSNSRYSFSKTPKTKIDWSTFFWKVNMLILIKSLWTRRIQLWKPCRIFYFAFWNFVCQNPKRNDGNNFSFREKNFGYEFPLDKYISV